MGERIGSSVLQQVPDVTIGCQVWFWHHQTEHATLPKFDRECAALGSPERRSWVAGQGKKSAFAGPNGREVARVTAHPCLPVGTSAAVATARLTG